MPLTSKKVRQISW